MSAPRAGHRGRGNGGPQRVLNDMASQRAYSAGQQAGQDYDPAPPRQSVCPQCRTETHGAAFRSGHGHHLAEATT